MYLFKELFFFSSLLSPDRFSIPPPLLLRWYLSRICLMRVSGGVSAGALNSCREGAYALILPDKDSVLHRPFDHPCGIASCKGHRPASRL